jgi:hypothetical protein
MRPGLVRAGGETVDVAVQHQVLARAPSFECADNVRELGLRGDDAMGQPLRIKKARDMRRRLTRISGWIGTLRLHESAQELNKPIAVGVDPLE